MKPTISIIVPVYNIESYIRKCLDSILSQSFKEFEVIVVDDGSTDCSGVICDEYAKKDERINVLHKDYGGVSSARNAGVRAARGEYIGFVDGDDYVDANMYETLYRSCAETNSDISICKLEREINGELINDDGGKFYTKELNHQEAMGELFKGILYRFSLCNKLFKRTCFENVFFPEGRIHEDLSTTYKLFANANKAVFMNYIGYIYVKQQNSILTSSYSDKRLDAFIGWDEIMTYMQLNYPQLANAFTPSFTYGCLDNIYYVLNQVFQKRKRFEQLKVIQTYVRKYYWKIMKSSGLSLTCKFLIVIFNLSIHVFIFSRRIKDIASLKWA